MNGKTPVTDPTASMPRQGSRHPLVIDQNHGLLRTDLLYETFWRCMTTNPAGAVAAFFGAGGKARIKQCLAAGAEIDFDLLSIHQEVSARLRAAQAEGRHVAFASAADRRLVEAIAARFGVPQIFASDGRTNLKGSAKAEVLCAAYGSGRFDYVGNAKADFAVWDHASRVLVVEPSCALPTQV